jgi:hypothetical protein
MSMSDCWLSLRWRHSRRVSCLAFGVGRGLESRFVLHGLLVGVVATLLYVGLTLARPEPITHLETHGLKPWRGARRVVPSPDDDEPRPTQRRCPCIESAPTRRAKELRVAHESWFAVLNGIPTRGLPAVGRRLARQFELRMFTTKE